MPHNAAFFLTMQLELTYKNEPMVLFFKNTSQDENGNLFFNGINQKGESVSLPSLDCDFTKGHLFNPELLDQEDELKQKRIERLKILLSAYDAIQKAICSEGAIPAPLLPYFIAEDLKTDCFLWTSETLDNFISHAEAQLLKSTYAFQKRTSTKQGVIS